jgi:DNA-binding protein H-NS
VEKLKNTGGDSTSMKKNDLEAMSVDELWSLHEEVSSTLLAKIMVEKGELEKRLAVLNRGRHAIEERAEVRTDQGKVRRKYPTVLPKYRNPLTSSETWSGRGKQPRWLAAAIKSGSRLEDFRIDDASSSKERRSGARSNIDAFRFSGADLHRNDSL